MTETEQLVRAPEPSPPKQAHVGATHGYGDYRPDASADESPADHEDQDVVQRDVYHVDEDRHTHRHAGLSHARVDASEHSRGGRERRGEREYPEIRHALGSHGLAQSERGEDRSRADAQDEEHHETGADADDQRHVQQLPHGRRTPLAIPSGRDHLCRSRPSAEQHTRGDVDGRGDGRCRERIRGDAANHRGIDDGNHDLREVRDDNRVAQGENPLQRALLGRRRRDRGFHRGGECATAGMNEGSSQRRLPQTSERRSHGAPRSPP